MFKDANDLANGEELNADVCIAGAGAAGITIARDLVQSGLSVIVLESGGLERDEETQALYDGEHTGIEGRALDDCRLRFFGGSTNHWGGWCKPLETEAFGKRSGVAPGWPLQRDSLIPWYRMAQETCGLGAFEYDAASVAARSDKSLLELDQTRINSVMYQFSRPRHFGPYFREALESAENVAVYLHANLVDIRLAESGAAVDIFTCATLEGNHFKVRARRFVLALGGIENARMLLASRSQNPAGVGNDHDLVGRYYMEHPHYYMAAVILARPDIDFGFYTQRERLPTVDMEEGANSSTRIMGALAVAPEICSRERLIKLTWQVTEPGEVMAMRLGRGTDADAIAALARTVGKDGFAVYSVNVRAEQRPLDNSRVRLGDDADALGIPRTVLHWAVADQDRIDILRSMEILGAELARNGVGRLWRQGGDQAQLYPVGGIYEGCHHMGTTRMAELPEQGVVDADCRVHGLSNLWVAGSSVFPSGGSANPTLTIVALAHRLAEKLKERAS